MRFVIQEHLNEQGEHWDLMLEIGGFLQTYRLEKHPNEIGAKPINAQKIFDHDLKFLTYEGPVNKGLGKVHIVDAGQYRILNENANELRLQFEGRILRGVCILRGKKKKGDYWCEMKVNDVSRHKS